MLDSEVTELVEKMIRVQFDERSEQLERDIQRALNKLALQGLGHSDAVVGAVYDLCARDIENRALIVWQNLLRVLSSGKIVLADTLAGDLKNEVLRYWPSIYSHASDCLEQVAKNAGMPSKSLTDVCERTLAKVHAEIDLLVRSLSRQKEANSGQVNSGQNIFYGPVGAVQTGPSSTATIIQNLVPQDRETLLNALQLVREALLRVDRLPAHPTDEVIDLVVEAQTELEKPKPNNTRLHSIFMTVAAAIQTVGSIQPAYQALKTALLALGITLP